VLLVLAAGFIGQFGKRLADYLIARRRKRLDSASAPPLPEPAQMAETKDRRDKADAKVAKKTAKAAVKQAKKAD